MKKIHLALIVPLLAVAAPAASDETVLVRQGQTTVSTTDLQVALENFVPERSRSELLANEKRLRDFVAQLFAVRKLADESKERTLKADELAKINAATERAAAQVQLDHLVAAQPAPDFEKAAREFYLANPKQFQRPERVSAQHVLIKPEGRSKDEALTLAKHVLALAKKGDQDFAKLAEEFSEDPSGKENGGNLGLFARGAMVKAFEDAAFSLQKVGELAGPVETQFGYHVIRLVERTAETLIPFDEVKDKLIGDETLKFKRASIAREYERIGKLPGIEVDQAAISALVKPIDMKAAGASQAQ